MDKSSFYFVQNCGACHPGGGWGEFDRKGNIYYDDKIKKSIEGWVDKLKKVYKVKIYTADFKN